MYVCMFSNNYEFIVFINPVKKTTLCFISLQFLFWATCFNFEIHFQATEVNLFKLCTFYTPSLICFFAPATNLSFTFDVFCSKVYIKACNDILKNSFLNDWQTQFKFTFSSIGTSSWPTRFRC